MKKNRWTLHGYSKEDLEGFCSQMSRLKDLLDEIETERGLEMEITGSKESVLRSRDDLRDVWDAVFRKYGDLLIKLSLPSEEKTLQDGISQVLSNMTPIDSNDPDAGREIAVFRGQIKSWAKLVVLYQLVELKLRPAMKHKPDSEKEVQDVFEALLLGADVDYGRELPCETEDGSQRRADFIAQEPRLPIEVKLCSSKRRQSEIKDEICADIMSYGVKFQRLFFVVYDCGFIDNPFAYEASLESLREGTTVRVIKH